ncbi:MAG: type II secretion system F family protein [Acidobacteria bacterium]|nr:type II secretion system F family protein [Acidobacteriota bacterium]
MPEFIARIGTADGTVMERSFVADSETALRAELQQQEYLILGIRKKSALGRLLPDFTRKRSIKMSEFLLFNQEFAALIRAGLPIIASLDILIERRKNEVFRKTLSDIRDRVRGGASLSEAFDAQGEMFPKIYSSTLASGERSGEVATMLHRFITYQKTIATLQRKVIAALIYPVCLLLLSIGIVAILVVYVVPKFVDFYADFGADLPLITRLMLGISQMVTNNLVLITAGILAAAFAFRTWAQTDAGRLVLDRVQVKLPLFGGIFHRFAITRFVRTLGTLLAGGIPAVTALGISARAVGNRAFEIRLMDVERKVREGGSIWQSLDETQLFSDIAIEMTRVGEQTGALHEMLENISEFYDEEIETRLGLMMALLEPLMLIGMGVIVAFMLLAIYLPLLRSYAQSSY